MLQFSTIQGEPSLLKADLNRKLHSHFFLEYCTRKLFETLEAENALDILEVASKLDLDFLIQKSRAIALWNSHAITNSDAFFNLSADQVEG